MEISIKISQAEVMQDVRRMVEYIGAKSADDTIYERVSIVDEDMVTIRQWWDEMRAVVVERLTRKITSEGMVDGEDTYLLVLRVSEAFDKALEPSMRRGLKYYFIEGLVARWCALVGVEDTRGYAGHSLTMLEEVRKIAFSKSAPERPHYIIPTHPERHHHHHRPTPDPDPTPSPDPDPTPSPDPDPTPGSEDNVRCEIAVTRDPNDCDRCTAARAFVAGTEEVLVNGVHYFADDYELTLDSEGHGVGFYIEMSEPIDDIHLFACPVEVTDDDRIAGKRREIAVTRDASDGDRCMAAEPFVVGTEEVLVNGLHYFNGDYVLITDEAGRGRGFVIEMAEDIDEIHLYAVVGE